MIVSLSGSHEIDLVPFDNSRFVWRRPVRGGGHSACGRRGVRPGQAGRAIRRDQYSSPRTGRLENPVKSFDGKEIDIEEARRLFEQHQKELENVKREQQGLETETEALQRGKHGAARHA